MYVYVRVLDPMEQELVVSGWELNPGPLKKHPVLLNTESSLQPPLIFFYYINFLNFQNVFLHLIYSYLISVLNASYGIPLIFDQSLVALTVSNTVYALHTLLILLH